MATISKIEGAKRTLAAAIRLFFERGDAVAIHTLAAAAQGVIRDIAKSRGSKRTSILHDNPHVPPHAQKQWMKILNAPRNFFKHADSDPDGALEFDERANETLLLDGALILCELEEYLQEANTFIGWFTTANPELRDGITNNQIGDYAVRNGVKPTDFDEFRELCETTILIERKRD